MKRTLLLLLLCGLLLNAPTTFSQIAPLPTTTPAAVSEVQPKTSPSYLRNQRLGIAHISAAEGGTSDLRYQQALTLGAHWNRYPIYWDRIETAPGQFDWQRYDIQIADDIRHQLGINAILLGRPSFRAEGDRIQGLNEPIFANGSDLPAEGLAINPGNPWAVFVYETVNRYKPGGTLAQMGALPKNAGVTVWEIWNEPDFKPFWSGSILDYARLLKVAYIAAHHADPNADVMFAGLVFGGGDNWLARVLAIYIDDPFGAQFNYYMDQVAVHSYANPWRTGWLVLNVRQTLVAYEIDRPIWVTETGVPVWDDYPGPTWAVSASEADRQSRALRATQEQQANFVIQSAAYAWVEGADVVIFHQLYDDCGDQPPGTNFPPHGGELCTNGNICAGDAHGFFRNQPSSVCFSQHPAPGTGRTAALAYKFLAQIFNEPFEKGGYLDEISPDAVVMQFNRVLAGERVVVMWSKKLQNVTVKLPAEGTNAQLLSLDSSAVIVPDEDGSYLIELPGASPDNYPEPPFGADTAIGGKPLILIEKVGGAVTPITVNLDIHVVPAEDAPPSAVTPTPGSVIRARPTTDPAKDTQPPQAVIAPLPPTSPATFTVSWIGQDDSGIASYTVWVRVDGGRWQSWLETADTSAAYTGQPGSLYEFDVWAVDLAGNWSSEVELVPRVATRVEG
jgi:hypothetical protein